jgi:hypothetical protein
LHLRWHQIGAAGLYPMTPAYRSLDPVVLLTSSVRKGRCGCILRSCRGEALDAARDRLDRRWDGVGDGMGLSLGVVAGVLLYGGLRFRPRTGPQGVRRRRRRSWLHAAKHGGFGRWWQGMVWHRAAGGRRWWLGRNIAMAGLLGPDRGLAGGSALSGPIQPYYCVWTANTSGGGGRMPSPRLSCRLIGAGYGDALLCPIH